VFFNEHLSQQSSAIKGLRRKTQIGQDPLSHSEPLATLIPRPSRARKVQTTAARRHCRPGLPKRRDGVIPPCLVEACSHNASQTDASRYVQASSQRRPRRLVEATADRRTFRRQAGMKSSAPVGRRTPAAANEFRHLLGTFTCLLDNDVSSTLPQGLGKEHLRRER
jgi:hypothetical protein